MSVTPTFRDLTREEVDALLARQHVGRIAFAFHDRVDIEPIGYVFAGAWLIGRTSPGSKLTTLGHNRWVAFEVDEVRSMFDWTSAVVHGTFYPLEPDRSANDLQTWTEAVERLREAAPETLTDEDPVAFRNVVFRIAVDRATGRTCGVGPAV